ncbi:MAG: DUF2796 domain-containing protein [Pseudomonadota bacterium]
MPNRILLSLAASTLALPALAETRELHAHEHGHVTLQVAVDGQTVEMMLEAPGADIVGFEHVAETDEQKAAVDAARADLSDPMALFVLPEAAGCTGAAAEVELHQDGDHNAFEAAYSLTCTNPSALTEIETRFFDLYPSVEEIDVEYVTPAGQGAGELEPGAALPLPTS